MQDSQQWNIHTWSAYLYEVWEELLVHAPDVRDYELWLILRKTLMRGACTYTPYVLETGGHESFSERVDADEQRDESWRTFNLS